MNYGGVFDQIIGIMLLGTTSFTYCTKLKYVCNKSNQPGFTTPLHSTQQGTLSANTSSAK